MVFMLGVTKNFGESDEARRINNVMTRDVPVSAIGIDIREVGDYFRGHAGRNVDGVMGKLARKLGDPNYRMIYTGILTGVISEAKSFDELKGVLERSYFMYSDAVKYTGDGDFGLAFGSPGSKYSEELNGLRRAVGKKMQELGFDPQSGKWRSDPSLDSIMYYFFNADRINRKLGGVVRELTEFKPTAAPRADYYAEYLKMKAVEPLLRQGPAINHTIDDIAAGLKKTINGISGLDGFEGLISGAGTREGTLAAHFGWISTDSENLKIYNAALERAKREMPRMDLRLRDDMSFEELDKLNTLVWEGFLAAHAPTSLDAFKQASDKQGFKISFIRPHIQRDMVLIGSWQGHSTVSEDYMNRMRRFAFEDKPIDAASINAYYLIKFGLHKGGVRQGQQSANAANAATTATVPPVNSPMVA